MPIRLKSIEFLQTGKIGHWSLSGLDLGSVNLLVGKNSTGKSRVINLISSLANQLLNPKQTLSGCKYEVVFTDSDDTYEYTLDISDDGVDVEKLTINGEVKLERGQEGLEIYAEEASEVMKFKPSRREVSAVARRDELQHSYLQPLKDWGNSVRTYRFGRDLGKSSVVILVETEAKLNDRDETQVVSIFREGVAAFPETFSNSVLDDMKSLGYELEKIEVTHVDGINIVPKLPAKPLAITVKEDGVDSLLDQTVLSQGMFRALSIISQITYSQLANRASCILIDDIGEGLDFERAAGLIALLREKAIKHGFQLLMSTNDQFVMNHVPLDEWSVLVRTGADVMVKNINNSEKAFRDFKFVGMNNFSFLELDFVNQPEIK